MAEDRRVRKTKNQIKLSFCKLFEETEFEKITVKGIALLADISRRTFYLHYKDIYDLIEQIEQDFIQDFNEMVSNWDFEILMTQNTTVMEQILNYIYENIQLCKAMVKYGDTHFLEEIFKTAKEYILKQYPTIMENENKEKFEIIFLYISGGLLSVVREWLKDGLSMGYDDVVKILHKLIASSFQAMST